MRKHIARIDSIEDDKFYTVSFVKRQSSGADVWYTWPLKDDVSSVERDEIIKLCDPVQDIVSGAGSIVRAKLYFNETDIDNARKMMNIPIRNIR